MTEFEYCERALEFCKRVYKKGYEQGKKDAVKHGHWMQNWAGFWMCSACGIESFFPDGTPEENGAKYCPCCGAMMDEEE